MTQASKGGNQHGTTRLFTDKTEDTSPSKKQCANCGVLAVPRGITSTKRAPGVAGEKHCPNCGHIHGRANH